MKITNSTPTSITFAEGDTYACFELHDGKVCVSAKVMDDHAGLDLENIRALMWKLTQWGATMEVHPEQKETA